MIRFRCPSCESEMEVDESFAGRQARCPTCGCNLKVPKEGEAPPPVQPARATPRKGATTITIDGEQVEVVPPLESMVFVSMGFVLLSVAAALVVGLGRFVTPPWAVGGTLGALLALLGMLIAVPSYHTVRRSRGRKRGRTHALIAMAAGALLFLVFGVTALVGWSHWLLRPTCEQNLKKIYHALVTYADKHAGVFPQSLDVLAQEGYLENPNRLICPSYRVPVGETSYILTPNIDTSAKRPDGSDWWPLDTMIVSDGPPYKAHGDGFVRALLLGGDVKHVKLTEWAAYQKAQGDRWNKILRQIRQAREEAARKDASAPTDAPPAAPAKEGSP